MRAARRPTGTGHSTSAGAAGASCGGCRAAGVDTGTLPGRRWADPDRAGLGWQGGRVGGLLCPLLPPLAVALGRAGGRSRRRSWRQIWPPGSSSCWRRSRGSARRRHAVPAARPLKPLQPGGPLPSRPRGRRRRREGGRRNFLEVALDLGWFFLGNDFSAILGSTVVPLLREGGPRIPILRSIAPCAGCFWTNFTHFHLEDGLVPEVDSGDMLMRQSTVTFG